MKRLLRTVCYRCIPPRYLMTKIRDGRAVALTFDDGPHPKYTEPILKVLREEEVKATFFLVGNEVKKYPDLARAIAEEGHEIGNHTFSHCRLNGMKFHTLSQEIDETTDLIQRTTGVSTRLFRPPYARVTVALLRYAFRYRITIVLWSIDSRDSFEGASPLKMRYEIRSVGPGDILLLHEDYPHTVEALQGIVHDLKAKNLNFTTVNEWVNENSP